MYILAVILCKFMHTCIFIVCECIQEDFHTLTYGFKMAGDETDAAVMSPVKELEEELGRVIKVCTVLHINVGFFHFIQLCLQGKGNNDFYSAHT